jgi:hypothetical protein
VRQFTVTPGDALVVPKLMLHQAVATSHPGRFVCLAFAVNRDISSS